ncbi:MAG: cellulase family glycosylhydrolase [Chloroflexota bacterium]
MAPVRVRRASTRHVKLVLAFVLLAGLAAVVGVVLVGMGRLLFVAERGGHPAPIENPIVEMTAAEPGAATWTVPAAGAGRALDPGTRDRITDAYLRALRGVELALESCSAADLHTWLAPQIEAQVTALIDDAKAGGCTLRRSDGGHVLQPTFVSEDGGVVAFSDRGGWVVDRVVDPAGHARYLERTADRDVVMRLDDGIWRVAAWRETGTAGVGEPPLAVARPGFVAAQGGELVADGAALHLDGVDYYPADTPWRDFWAKYDPAVVETDLRRAQRLGFDSIRVFVPYGQGPDHPDDVALTGLDDLLGRARALGLRVVVTLFDLDVNYDPGAWSGADRFIDRVVGRYADDPTILAWDLKNEADLDDRRVGAPLVDQWLLHVLRRLRTLDTGHLVTVGWSTPAMAARLADRLDLVSFHDYGTVSGLGARLATADAAVTAAVTGGRPALLTEYGASSWTSPLAPGGLGVAGQAREVAALRDAIAAEPTLDGAMLWGLNDFSGKAAAAPGASAWRKGVERSFGVIAADGTDKPVAAVLAGGAAVAPAGSMLPGPWTLMVLLAGLLGVLRGAWWAWRRRRAGRVRAVVTGLLFPVAWAGAYVALGLAFTFVAEMIKLGGTTLWVLAAVALLLAGVVAEVLVRITDAVWSWIGPRLPRIGRRRRSGATVAVAAVAVATVPTSKGRFGRLRRPGPGATGALGASAVAVPSSPKPQSTQKVKPASAPTSQSSPKPQSTPKPKPDSTPRPQSTPKPEGADRRAESPKPSQSSSPRKRANPHHPGAPMKHRPPKKHR